MQQFKASVGLISVKSAIIGVFILKEIEMIFRQLITYCLLLTLFLLSAQALPPRSPAGGKMLQLDETHDYVGTGEAWFPDEQFEQLTVEAWIYFEEPAGPSKLWSIIGQEGRFNFIVTGGGSLGSWAAHKAAKDTSMVVNSLPLPTREWVHVVGMYYAKAGMGFNGKGGIWCCPGGHFMKSYKPLRIGGIIPKNQEKRYFSGENVKFRGFIDEMRISNILRYPDREWKIPQKKFKVDEHTISLWHFDEAPWLGRFKDESGNGYDLWRGDSMSVEAGGKLTTKWGELKR
ncbi:LamG domain-containing protein [Candidatus Poribacteria bacterium]|nr:LamG domain-containing protein [Candidatus Poribacteria bacterium]